MLEAIERRRARRSPSRPTSTGPARSACSSRRALARARAGGRQGQDPARRGRLVDHRRRDPRRCSRPAGCQLAWYNPIQLVHHRPLQPPHASQVAHHRRPRRASPAAPASPITGWATRRTPTHWRDMQIRLEGPAVTPLQTGFAQNWLQTTGELMSGGSYYPAIEPRGDAAAADDHELAGDRRVDRPHDVLPVDRLRAPSRSTSPIPYFVPDPVAIDTLIEAKRRGVDVRIMVAGIRNDNWLARQNSVRLYGAPARGRHRDPRIQPHDAPSEDDGRRRRLGARSARPTSTTGRSRTTKRTTCASSIRALHGSCMKHSRPIIAGCQKIQLEEWRRRGPWRKIQEFMASFLQDQV